MVADLVISHKHRRNENMTSHPFIRDNAAPLP